MASASAKPCLGRSIEPGCAFRASAMDRQRRYYRSLRGVAARFRRKALEQRPRQPALFYPSNSLAPRAPCRGFSLPPSGFPLRRLKFRNELAAEFLRQRPGVRPGSAFRHGDGPSLHSHGGQSQGRKCRPLARHNASIFASSSVIAGCFHNKTGSDLPVRPPWNPDGIEEPSATSSRVPQSCDGPSRAPPTKARLDPRRRAPRPRGSYRPAAPRQCSAHIAPQVRHRSAGNDRPELGSKARAEFAAPRT